MRSAISSTVLEQRRRRAVELVVRDGWTQTASAEEVGASLREVQRWMQQYREGGWVALKARSIPGRPPKLTEEQKRELCTLLMKGPEAHGFEGGLWTCPRVARVIKKEFGVEYNSGYVPRLLRSLGWSLQRPTRQAAERDEEAMNRWRRRRWAAIKKSPKTR